MKLNYLTPKEAKMPKELLLLQCVLGLETCKTKDDVIKIFEDVWKIARQRKKVK